MHSIYSSEQVAIPQPPAPTGLIATAISSTQINLIWNDIPNETSYTLFRSTGNDTNSATNIAGLFAGVTNYTNIGLLPDTTYYYWVKAFNGSGASGFSTVASDTTLPLFSPSPGLDTNAPWPMFMQNVRHTGWTNENVLGVQKNPVEKWSYTTGSVIFSSPAIGSDGTIYVGSDDGKLYAITNGALKWSYTTGYEIFSSPAIGADGTIYVGSYEQLYAITNGALKWSYYISTDLIYSSLAIGADGTIYMESEDNKLYAITNGALKWSYATEDMIFSSPAIGADGTIYVGSAIGKLYAITNGALKWSYSTGQIIFSSPAIGADGTIYVGSVDGKLYAITNGALKWSFTTGGGIESSPAIGADGTIYVGSDDNKLYAITNGALKWLFTTGGMIKSSPAIGADGTIYVGSDDNKLYAITNGTLKWSFTTGGMIKSSPAIGADGTIYVGSDDNKLYAIKQNNEPEILWGGNSGYINDGIDPDNGISGQYYRFEIKYEDMDNDYPLTNQVWIDLNDNSSYESNEKFTMYSNTGTSYSNGVIYTNSIQIDYAGDGSLNYRFYFIDKYGYASLPCAGTSNNIFVIFTNVSLPPQWISATPVSTNQIDLVWENVSNETSYTLFRSTGNDTNFATNIAGLSADVTNYTNIGLTPDTTYYYWVKAYNGSGSSGFSAVASNTTLPGFQQFTLIQEPMGANLGVNESSIAFGDYDNDGDLDIALTGTPDGLNYRFIIYQNDAGIFNQVQEPMGANLGARSSSIAFGNYDNDGDLDIALTGWDNGLNDRFIIYQNDAGVFNPVQEPMGANLGVSISSIAYGDIDNDGDLDIALTGWGGACRKLQVYNLSK